MEERKLALSDELLLSVEKPARYIGGELNSVNKNLDEIDIRFCMCFPDVYEIGMSHLGIQILYDMFNQRKDTFCERVYSPWMDLHIKMKEQDIPLFSLETQTPIKQFDFLGITIQYEMCYTNIIQILDLSKIPVLSKDRTSEDPIVIGGGPCTYNPEPVADFFDLFYIGEGETVYDQLLDLYKEYKHSEMTRDEFLSKAAQIEGIYVPSLTKDGQAVGSVKKQVVSKLSETYYPEKPLVPYIQVTQDRAVLEIQRGCIRGCRFCQAGMIYRPIRERSLEFLKDKADKMLTSTGYDEISLSSLSSSDYSQLPELVYYLIDEYKGQGINISLPSLRIDAFALDVMQKVQDVKKSSLTFAPEAGSQRMRDVINKGLTKEDILSGAMDAFQSGWTRVKLYFMLGLPGETDEDIEQIAVLANDIAAQHFTIPKEERQGRPEITVSTSFFIPKPFTPFQWAKMDTPEEFERKRKFLLSKINEQINRRSIKYQCHDAKTSELEGVFARGDRRLGKVIYDAYKKGCLYDSWTEFFKPDVWQEAFDENHISQGEYNYCERPDDMEFPWDYIDIGVRKQFLLREWKNAMNAKVTPNCRTKCSGCGAGSFGVGICVNQSRGE